MAKALLKPPRLRTAGGGEGEQHATWLELFYDLVFAVALIHLSHVRNEPMAHRTWQIGSRFLAAALVLASGLRDLSPLLLLVVVATICTALVSFDFALELTGPEADQREATAVNVAELD